MKEGKKGEEQGSWPFKREEEKNHRGRTRRTLRKPCKTDHLKQKLILAFAQTPVVFTQGPFLFAHSPFVHLLSVLAVLSSFMSLHVVVLAESCMEIVCFHV